MIPTHSSTAFAGVDRLLLVSTDALDKPGRRLAQHRNAIAAAAKAGVKHIVYTSAPNARPLGRSGILDDHYWSEQALAASGLDWTILRNHIYAEISLMGLPHALATGKLFTATGSGGRSYVTRDDCARAAAGALVKATGRQILDVTGPKPVTQNELAQLVSTLTGKQIAHVPVSGADLAKGLAGAGLPPLLVEALGRFRRRRGAGLPCHCDAGGEGFQRPRSDAACRFSQLQPRRPQARRLSSLPRVRGQCQLRKLWVVRGIAHYFSFCQRNASSLSSKEILAIVATIVPKAPAQGCKIIR